MGQPRIELYAVFMHFMPWVIVKSVIFPPRSIIMMCIYETTFYPCTNLEWHKTTIYCAGNITEKGSVNSPFPDRPIYWVFMAVVFALNSMLCPVWLTASSKQPSFSSQTVQMTICKGAWEKRCGLSNRHIHINTEENNFHHPIFNIAMTFIY